MEGCNAFVCSTCVQYSSCINFRNYSTHTLLTLRSFCYTASNQSIRMQFTFLYRGWQWNTLCWFHNSCKPIFQAVQTYSKHCHIDRRHFRYGSIRFVDSESYCFIWMERNVAYSRRNFVQSVCPGMCTVSNRITKVFKTRLKFRSVERYTIRHLLCPELILQPIKFTGISTPSSFDIIIRLYYVRNVTFAHGVWHSKLCRENMPEPIMVFSKTRHLCDIYGLFDYLWNCDAIVPIIT